ncbi:PAS domain-containing sensor histidine kinase [Flavobacterium franklandianum]|uniref:histidine kinase n=1 Tax=Flavobacterium franklandianum TaxID=2594430 RepID=A0A553CQK2_9FLAO|nr:PAS domain S-box protein [Flavobacterium franklandianum]TRX22802.1 PAS domain S-box protein [Flavobacterium franklandianum]
MNPEAYKLSDAINFQQEFNDILSFISEICEVPHVLISQVDNEVPIIKAQIGLELKSIPQEIVLNIISVIEQNTIITVSKNKVSTKKSFEFFIGFPLCNDDNLPVRTLCLFDVKSRKLSSIQLKTLSIAAKQIQSFLSQFQKNQDLLKLLKLKETQFQLFIDNSKEIFYELNTEGVIIYVSNNWTTFLGYELDEVIGKSISLFLHPEDLEIVTAFLNNKIEIGENKITYRILHKEGQYTWHTSSFKLSEKNGEIIYIGNCRDITEHIEIQQKILQQKEFYEKILDQVPTDVAAFDQDHRYLYLNQAAIKDNELRKFIIGKDDFEYAKHTGRDDSSAKKRRAKFLQAMEFKNLIQWEDCITSPYTGLTSYHTRKLNPVFHKDGTFEMMIGFGVDITQSKKAQEEILKSKQLLSSIMDNVAVGILVQGPESEILENNKAACEMLGLTNDQLIGKTSFDKLWKIIHLDGSDFLPEDNPVPMAIKLLKPVKNVVMGVYRPISMDMVWLLVDAIPVFDDSGILLYVVCSFNDITELKKIEDKLKISNERFTYSSEATSDAIWDWNILNDDIFVGASYSNLFGHKFKDNMIKGQVCENFVHPEDRKSCFINLENTLRNKTITKWSDEYRYLKSDGSYAYVHDKAIIIRDEKGKAIRMIGAMQDITNKKRLEDELRQSEEQFKGAFEHSPVGMALVDIEGYYTEVNDILCEMLGYSNQEMKSLTFQEITYYIDLEVDLEHKKSLDSGNTTNFNSEKRFIKKNNSLVWTYNSVSLVKNSKNETYYIVQIIDITKRKEIELQNKLLIEENNKNRTIQLNEAKNMYRFLAENSVDLICLHNLDTSFQYVSPSVINILGYTPEEMVGKSPMDYAHPEELKHLQDSFMGFIDEKVNDFTIARFLNKDGKYIWLETKANIIKEKGVNTGFQSSSRDVTTRKIEEEIIKKTLEKERELNELRSNLVSTVSHEFRTPMTTIRTSAELISIYLEGQTFEKKPRLEKQLMTITGEIDRIVELMNSVLTISRDDAGKTNFNPVSVDLKQLCIDVIETSFDNQKDGSKVQTFFKGTNFRVFADKNLMEYSIFNLLNNAFKYSVGSGNILMNLLTTSSKVVLEIIDFGIGIPDEDQPKLFNTFFRASNTNGISGTGLGLYIVKTFTEKNSGNIKLESNLGKGTKVSLQFPLQKP